MKEKYIINEFDEFAKEIREIVARNLGADDMEDINSYITVNQVKGLIIEHATSMKNDKPILDEKGLFDACEEIQSMIMDAGLSKLAAKGLIECSWSDEDEDFIFWLPDKK
jgi:hypothetical protein